MLIRWDQARQGGPLPGHYPVIKHSAAGMMHKQLMPDLDSVLGLRFWLVPLLDDLFKPSFVQTKPSPLHSEPALPLKPSGSHLFFQTELSIFSSYLQRLPLHLFQFSACTFSKASVKLVLLRPVYCHSISHIHILKSSVTQEFNLSNQDGNERTCDYQHPCLPSQIGNTWWTKANKTEVT